MSLTMQFGKFYKVPAVRVREWNGFRGWVPVIGPKHDDAEIVNFPWPHFHIDWRFVSTRLFEARSVLRGQSFLYGMPISCPDTYGRKVIEEGPTLKRMKYKHRLPPYPTSCAPWLAALEKKYACSKLTKGLCPHRLIPVSAMIRDGDVLTCPGHGLRWHAVTGELIPNSCALGSPT